MTNLKKKTFGFTLIEILVVVAIISILAVIAYIAINPAEAQRKARDAQRVKDIATIQSLLEQYITDNITTVTAAMTSVSTASAGSNNCATGWMGLNMCPYANILPRDPANRTTLYTTTGGTSTGGVVAYGFGVDASAQYRICAKLESNANAGKLSQDGLANNYYELYSATGAPLCSAILP